MIRTTRIHPLRLQAITSYPPRRGGWPHPAALLLTFILGLLAGWVLRGGGAWLP